MSQKKIIYQIILIVFSITLFSTYIMEYIIQLTPCILCLCQRSIHLLMIYISIIAIAGKGTTMNKYSTITIIVAIVVGVYHIGIEKGIFLTPNICKPLININSNMSTSDVIRTLYDSDIILTTECSKPNILVYNISISELNVIINVISLFLFLKYKNQL